MHQPDIKFFVGRRGFHGGGQFRCFAAGQFLPAGVHNDQRFAFRAGGNQRMDQHGIGLRQANADPGGKDDGGEHPGVNGA